MSSHESERIPVNGPASPANTSVAGSAPVPARVDAVAPAPSAGVDNPRVVASLDELPERLSYRSTPALVMGSALSVLLVGAAVGMWAGMGSLARSQWTLPQLVTIIFFLIVVLVIVMSVGLSKVVAAPSGVTVRNAVRTHRYPWSAVEDFVMSPGDPWVYLKLADTPEEEGDTRLVLGVQRSEGDVAEEKLEMLRAYARKHRDA